MLHIRDLRLLKMGQRQFGSILTNFLQFWTHTTRPNVTKLFREVVLWLGGGTTCFWNERGVDAEFQSWEEGDWWGNGEERGTGGETRRRGVTERKGAPPALTTARTTCLRKSTLTVTSST